MSANNKRKGSNAERLYAKKFRDLSFSFCETSRFASKKHDNAKIDLVFIPFNLQIKAGVQKNMNPGKELMFMNACIETMFPANDEVHHKPKLLVHYEHVGRGVKRTPNNEKIYMSLSQFNEFKKLNSELIYDGLKSFKFCLDCEFKDIVNMTFNYFVEQIVIKHYISNGKNSN